MSLEILEVDPRDDAAFAEWHAVYDAADREGRVDPVTWDLRSLRTMFLQDSGTEQRRGFVGRADGRAVVVGDLRLPLVDNRHRAQIVVFARPDARRRGYGGAMLAHLERLAVDLGRTTMGAEAVWPYDGGPEGHGEPGAEFARRHGYDLVLADVRRRLSLPLPDDLLDRLEKEAAPSWSTGPSAYTLRSFRRPVPDDIVEGWARLEAAVETEAPVGGLDIEPATPDVGAVRHIEALFAEQGRSSWGTVALDAMGDAVAYTELVMGRHERVAYQWGTLVQRRHRGHRLGLALKIANLRLLVQDRPDATAVNTYNAESNDHMIAVNEALGFVPVERMGEFQKRL
ncbi:GNAT family N-acetyltransferase [Nocardioides sp. KR10-350]|uniref:GNAT family N-acetyltransferase n=1 Tax=Nocardioides cheoyonin TaxID=3156615 RepID=UPI0032B49174